MNLQTSKYLETICCPFDVTNPEEDAVSYPAVQVVLNVYLFHLDILSPPDEEGSQYWSRYIFSNIKDVLSFLNENGSQEAIISLQSRRGIHYNSEYEISTILEITEAWDDSGKCGFIISCTNGKSYLNSFFAGNDHQLIHKKVIYMLPKL